MLNLMKANTTLLSIGNFNLKINHLMVFLVICLSFSISFLIRSIPGMYGLELNEFDPFYNYRATEYLVENGLESYLNWNDSLSWYPYGRDVSSNSQLVLHVFTGFFYWFFANAMSLYDFTIFFPVIIGSLTTAIIFLLVRKIAGTTAGLFSSLLFSISLPIILRGTIGWFKSEPLGIFLGLLSVYLFLSAITSKNIRSVIPKLIIAGILLPTSLSAWGGNQFFIIILSMFIFSLPFTRRDNNFLSWTIPLFVISSIFTSFIFERPGISYVSGITGMGLIFSTIFLEISIFIKNKSSDDTKFRNCGIFLLIIIFASVLLIYLNDDTQLLNLPSYRYLNSINPLLTTSDPLTDSIAEHSTTSIEESFTFHSILLIFSSIGIWIIFKNFSKKFFKNDLLLFTLIFGIFGVYISSSFMRLEIFASLSLIIFSSIALSFIIKNFSYTKIKNRIRNSILLIGISFLLMSPLILSANTSVFEVVNHPPTILNGGTNYKISTLDWVETLDWIKNNTSEDSVIAAWWDYGYWIQTKAERATLVDNSTLADQIIKKMANIFFSETYNAWEQLEEMESDYIVITVAGERLGINGLNDQGLYLLKGGGDESKKFWFIKIGEKNIADYLYDDRISGNDNFWNNTLLGKLIPFEIVGYVDPISGNQYLSYLPGTIGVYEKKIKFSENDPFELVYSSSSYDVEPGNMMISVFVYKINHNYNLEN